jgi:hypothetical protein
MNDAHWEQSPLRNASSTWQVLRTETKKSKKWGAVLFEDGRFPVCFDPKSRGVGWAKLRVL